MLEIMITGEKGKTTLAKYLYKHLKEKGLNVIIKYEPFDVLYIEFTEGENKKLNK